MRCRETNARGEPCEAPDTLIGEDGYCPAHRPGGREELLKRAHKGGQANRKRLRAEGLKEGELPPLTSPHAAERWAEIVGRAVATGRLTHSQGKAIGSLLREWRQSHEAGAVAERVDEILSQLETVKKRGGLRAVDGGRA